MSEELSISNTAFISDPDTVNQPTTELWIFWVSRFHGDIMCRGEKADADNRRLESKGTHIQSINKNLSHPWFQFQSTLIPDLERSKQGNILRTITGNSNQSQDSSFMFWHFQGFPPGRDDPSSSSNSIFPLPSASAAEVNLTASATAAVPEAFHVTPLPVLISPMLNSPVYEFLSATHPMGTPRVRGRRKFCSHDVAIFQMSIFLSRKMAKRRTLNSRATGQIIKS